ncbi:MAG: helix-hairpin-helix domain-containing protein [Flavobacteriales bacterium]|nr:helix-hairpin-helix domain-containing protein [Flavobacteriales bacterium]
MKLNKYCLLFLIILSFNPWIHGQDQDKKEDLDNIKKGIIVQRIETIAENNETENIDLSTIFDELMFYLNHPINLNRTSFEELQALYLLTDIQINNLMQHIEKYGKLMAIYELQSIPGFDIEAINEIRPFVSVKRDLDQPNLNLEELLKNGNNELTLRLTRTLEEMEGFSDIADSLLEENPNRRYLGNPNNYYLRYRYKYSNKISLSLIAEKDPGEEFFKGTQQQGFDYYSAHAYIQDFGLIKQAVIGDYQIEFGQGLTAWNSRAFNKSGGDVLGVKRNARKIRPYSSVNENTFFRGAAFTLGISDIELTGFLSRNRYDANILDISDSTGNEIITFSSLQTSGFHRTPNEIEDKGSITQNHMGGRVAYNKGRLNIGVSSITRIEDDIANPNIRLDNQFLTIEEVQKTSTNFGLDYNYVFKNINVFGELSRNIYGGLGQLHGILAALDPRVSIVAVYRNYPLDFINISSNQLRESRVSGEIGTYFGLDTKISKQWKLSLYYDQFRFPWLLYQVDGPSKGVEYLAQLTYKPNKKAEVYLRYREEIKQRNRGESADYIDKLNDRSIRSLRFNTDFSITDEVRLKNRVEFLHYNDYDQNEFGYLIYQDLVYKPFDYPIDFTGRVALFDTESYDSRIYAFENEVPYAFSIPAYSGTGMKLIGLIRYNLSRKVTFWFRASQTYFSHQTVIGSGLNEINGNTRTDIRLQCRLKF